MATEKLQLYNTMTKKLETFKPLVEGKVGMYVCGVTAYDLSHIGHARAYVAFDVLYRYLKHLNYDVKYVRNFTDVDDKIIRRANERGEDPLALSGRYCQEFLQDMDDLNCLRPSDQPRVSEHIDEIKKMIAKIMENNCAYEAEGGDVYFEVDKFPDYGKLSGRKLEHNRAGERVAVDSRKRNPADFALWKAAKPGELKWESPWGEGRPGWHIECSAMSACYLTHSFDIHGGGMDLTFPHHENELAQSCAACQESKVSYWVHNGFVNANDEKMSKSIGNFFTIREVTKLYHPLALRYFLMKSHYRSAVNYSIEEIEKASLAVFSVYQTLQGCEEALAPFAEGTQQEVVQQNGKKAQISKDTSAGIKKIQECISKLQSEFQKKMSNDLHAGDILTGVLDEALTLMNSSLSQLKKKKKRDEQLALSRSLKELENEVKQVLSIVGLLPPSTYSEVLQQLKDKALTRAGLTEADVQRVIEERVVVRKAGEYAKSDEMRGELLSKGIQLQDVGKETVWIPCIPIVQEDKKSSDQEDKKSSVQVDEKSTPLAPDAKAQGASILAPEAKAQAADLKEQEQVSPAAS